MTTQWEGTSSDVDDLLYDALKLDPSQREVWLRTRCADDEKKLHEVLSLLDAHQRSGEFLEAAAQWPGEDLDLIGQSVGVYRIDSLIANGGMGHVYLAHRNDGSYQQRVAIKVVEQGAIQLQLFQAERQILADLTHPAITTILDGGVMEGSGHPYLVMEYIDGVQITDFVHDRALSQSDRAALFLSLLEAVSQAHQRGIIHCDLKPANIFVDHDGDLKLLDFGVAYAVERSMGQSTGSGKHYGLTPGYCSPQRLAGECPVVADDIYSLGIVFGLIMTESTAHQYQIERLSELNEIEQSLTEETAAIFKKATHVQAEHRYSSAAAFADEMRNWASYRPLIAMKGGAGYRLQKNLRRHWVTWIGVGLLLGVMASSSIAWWQNQRADQAQALAELQVEVAIKLAKSVVRDLDIRVVLLEGSTLVRLSAAESALAKLGEINQAQPGNANIQLMLAQIHLKIAGLLAHPFLMHIGKIEEGRQHMKAAYLLHKALYRQQPTRRNLMALLISERFIAAQLVVIEDKLADALKLLSDRLQEIKQLKEVDAPAKSRISTRYTVIAHILVSMGRLDEAEIAYSKAANLLQVVDPELPEYLQERIRRGNNFYLDELALFQLSKGEYARSEQQLLQSIKRHEGEPLWVYKNRMVQANHALACIELMDRKNVKQAITYLKRSQTISTELVASFPAAVSLKWAASRYALLDEVLATGVDQAGDTQYASLVGAFQCKTPSEIGTPVGPPEGWELVRQQLSFSFVDIVTP